MSSSKPITAPMQRIIDDLMCLDLNPTVSEEARPTVTVTIGHIEYTFGRSYITRDRFWLRAHYTDDTYNFMDKRDITVNALEYELRCGYNAAYNTGLI